MVIAECVPLKTHCPHPGTLLFVALQILLFMAASTGASFCFRPTTRLSLRE